MLDVVCFQMENLREFVADSTTSVKTFRKGCPRTIPNNHVSSRPAHFVRLTKEVPKVVVHRLQGVELVTRNNLYRKYAVCYVPHYEVDARCCTRVLDDVLNRRAFSDFESNCSTEAYAIFEHNPSHPLSKMLSIKRIVPGSLCVSMVLTYGSIASFCL